MKVCKLSSERTNRIFVPQRNSFMINNNKRKTPDDSWKCIWSHKYEKS